MRLPVLLAGALVVVACVSTNAVKIGNPSPHPATLAENVIIYRTATQVPGRYEELALLNSTGSATSTSEAKMFKSMQEKAAELGANAIILDAMSEPSAGAKVAGAIFGVGGADRKGRAIAIYVFPKDSTTSPTAP
jgi:hypothetical protein